MDAKALTALIEAAMPGSQVRVVSEDNVHFDAVIISDTFAGMNRVKRQQAVYAVLNDYIASGEVHALAMKTLTSQEAAQ